MSRAVEEEEAYETEPLTNMEIRQAWLQCLTSAMMVFDGNEKEFEEQAAETADVLLAQFRGRFDSNVEVEDEEEEEEEEPRRRRAR
jgi:hypothetical protein